MTKLFRLKVEGVRIPEPLYWIDLGDKHVLVMEKLDAQPIHLYANDNKDTASLALPDNYDIDSDFSKPLEAFIKKMHELGFRHRDLHGGNVMINVVTKELFVIDLGKSKQLTFSDTDEFSEYNNLTRKTHRYMNDLVQVRELRNALLKKTRKGGSNV